jgi:hypothetical protein
MVFIYVMYFLITVNLYSFDISTHATVNIFFLFLYSAILIVAETGSLFYKINKLSCLDLIYFTSDYCKTRYSAGVNVLCARLATLKLKL